MRNWKAILYNLAIAANVLLLFFVLTEKWVVIPYWLQVAGRMHPLVLHFPIALLLMCIVLEWTNISNTQPDLFDGIWLTAINLTVFSALFGWILSREEGYDAGAITWHKWGGIFVSVFAFVWYTVRRRLQTKRLSVGLASVALLAALLVTGHEGAVLTHGDDFLLAPLKGDEDQPAVLFEQAMVFDHVVKPILEAKCISCHNTGKAKGELVMETAASILKGGKNGLLWDSTAKDYGLLLQRVHLPPDHKEHMPPKGKPQLTEQEQAILYHWIKSGGNFTARVAELAPDDSLRILTAALFSSDADTYQFAAASEATIEKLNSHYRVVQPIAAGSPALEVNYFGAAQFKGDGLKELLQIKDQMISLNLNRMPVTDADLELLTQFSQLSYLNLSFSEVSDKVLPILKKLPHLKELSLSGTKVTAKGLADNPIPVKHLFIWNTAISANELAAVQSNWKNTRIETGFSGDAIQIQLNAPIVENDEPVFREPFDLKLKHFVNGVDIRYTLDGSEPDSLNSDVYKPGVQITRTSELRARAFKKGWISSKTVTRKFFSAGGKPDSIWLLTPPDPSYAAFPATLLTDEQKGEAVNFKSGKWLGYRKPMEVAASFKADRTIDAVSISSLVSVGSYILPPAEIQVWGKPEDGGKWMLLASQQPKQPSKDTAQYDAVYTLKLKKPTICSQVKLVVKPVAKLPAWHPGKGEPGWVFVDELFFD